MSTDDTRRWFSRVLIEFDALSDGGNVIETACNLAGAMEAELHGLFVEDESLFDLSGLPFAHAVAPGRPSAQAINPELVRRTYERQAQAVRRTLSASAGSARISWTFDTARGRAAAGSGARASGGDLVVVQQQSLGQSTRDLIALARRAAAAASGVMVIGRQTRHADGPIVAIDDGDDTGEMTVAMAARLGRRLDAPVVLFILADDEDDARRIEARDLAILAGVHVGRVRRFLGPADMVGDALAAADARFVVADIEGRPFGDNESAIRMVRAARAPVILIRPRQSGTAGR